MMQHFVHGATRFYDPVGRQPFAQQIFPGNIRICKIDVADVVNYPTVDLFRYALIKTTVTSLHMKNRYMFFLGWNSAQTAVCISQNQEGIGLQTVQQLIDHNEYL